MIFAEVQTATIIAAIRLTATNVGQPAINCLCATRVIANGRNSVADVAIPVFIESNGPPHFYRFLHATSPKPNSASASVDGSGLCSVMSPDTPLPGPCPALAVANALPDPVRAY